MSQFQQVFKCKYPIFAAPMNKVSDANLAIAVAKAGGIGSISLLTYLDSPGPDQDASITAIKKLEQAIIEIKENTGSTNFLLSLRVMDTDNIQIKNIILKYNIPYLEIVDFSFKRPAFLEEYKAAGVLLFSKGYQAIRLADGIILKGPDGAGKVSYNHGSLKDLLSAVKLQYPDMLTIVTGGIGTPAQVKEYLDLGATMIGIGTLFAASAESCVSVETKLKMISSTSGDIQAIGSKFKQNAIEFSKLENDVPNHTKGLEAGMKSPESGLIFAGKAIDNVLAIRSVADIVNDLVSSLN